MKPVIEIHQISKKYFLQEGRRYLALRDVITNSFKNLRYNRQNSRKEFWALRDINLIITPGERVGIVGKNGAGKSTLLKIISRITPPSTGRAIVRGRLGSLLEVGTGFHPELTGRENVYLNGSIMGLKKKDIARQFDAIVDFSGVSPFLDTPLKNYSSGMQMRLAFAVAAHLDANILLIDEVLAVGDAEFQKKCLGKMKEISQEKGRTILFISHNMAVVKQLCTKGILLESGKITYQGGIQSTVAQYAGTFNTTLSQNTRACFDLCHHPNKVSDAEGLLSAALYVDGVLTNDFSPGSTLKILLTYKITSPLIDPEIGLIIKDEEDYSIIGLNNKHIGRKLYLKVGQEAQAVILIPGLNIYSPGRYHIDLYFGDGHHFYESLYYACNFTIPEYDVYNSGAVPGAQWNKIFIQDIDIQA